MNRPQPQKARYAILGVACVVGLVLLIGSPAYAQRKKVVAASPVKQFKAEDLPARKAMGSKSAPITIEVFSDFQCPACRRNYLETMKPLMDSYVASGKVYLMHRDFPLPMHSHSREAARWANAAAEAGKFEKVADVLYSKQDTWAASGNIEAVVAAVLTPAELKKVKQALAQPAVLDAAIEQDLALGQGKRVSQTPSLFVTHNGQTEALPPAGVSYSILRQYLDFLLKQ